MNRPWQVWLVFAMCVIAAAAGMAWLTRQALEADRLRRAAESEAELEQQVSLALWRMDTELAPIIAEEVIRPAAAYASGGKAIPAPQYVVLQFDASPYGEWDSPQMTNGKSRVEPPRLQELQKAIDLPQLLAELPSAPLPIDPSLDMQIPADSASQAGSQQAYREPGQYFAGNALSNPQVQQQAANPSGKPMKGSKVADFEQRNQRYQTAAQQSLLNRDRSNQAANQSDEEDPFGFPPSEDDDLFGMPSAKAERVGVSQPLWVGDRLLLARRVTIGNETHVQGAWLDWPQLKTRLLDEASDVLPSADLVPVKGDAETDPARMLAGLPVRLVVNQSAAPSNSDPTLRTALWLGWGAVLLAVSAAAVLLAGVMTLSERRAAFVSSVTHELRTPLTTFRMYAEMLARGMVPEASRRQEYFETLQRESERLTLLVENVLAYARLERGRKPSAHDRTTLGALLDRIGPRLVHRAAQSDMKCEVQLVKHPLPPGEGFDCEFFTDVAAVEQILFNLVDNASKYARGAVDRRIHVEAGRDGTIVRLTVRDHGPGIDNRPWSRRMRPFGKSAQESADSAPGVGLGLALCRRLARQLGGRLEIDSTPGGGATVSLLLPVA